MGECFASNKDADDPVDKPNKVPSRYIQLKGELCFDSSRARRKSKLIRQRSNRLVMMCDKKESAPFVVFGCVGQVGEWFSNCRQVNRVKACLVLDTDPQLGKHGA
jgi:hypothetical protein